MMLIYENGSGKYLRILPEAVQFVSSAHNATVIQAEQFEDIVRQHKLDYLRHTLELKRVNRDHSVIRNHVKGLIRKLSG